MPPLDYSIVPIKTTDIPETDLMSGVKEFLVNTTTEITKVIAKEDVRFPASQITDIQDIVDDLQAISDAAEATINGEAAAVVAAASVFEATHPETGYYTRVIADGGEIRSTAFMQRVFEANKDLIDDTELLFVPEAGMKVTDGKIEKLYNLVGTNDAVQAAVDSRWYAGNMIAGNEKSSLKSVTGMGYCALITGSAIDKGATDSYDIVLNVEINNTLGQILIGGGAEESSRIYFNVSQLILSNASSAAVIVATWDIYAYIGRNITIHFSYNNGIGIARVDGHTLASTTNPTTLSVGQITTLSTNPFDGCINYFALYNENLSAYESQNLHDFLSTEFPAIETIAVGSQQVATSNLEATVFGAVSVPEVQANSYADNPELMQASIDFTDGWSPMGGCVINSPNQLTITGSGGIVYTGMNYQYPKQLRISMVANLTSGNVSIRNQYDTNNQFIKSGAINFTEYVKWGNNPSGLYMVFSESSVFTITSVSIKYVGWSDAQTIYGARIAAGDTVSQANIAASAWSHYDNSAANGAIYGKMFNGYAVDTIAANAPQGFHVPSDLEWTMLSEYLGGNSVSGGKLKALHGGFDNAFATNESGVSLLAGGYRNEDGSFAGLNQGCAEWNKDLWYSDFNYLSAAMAPTDGNTLKKLGLFCRLFSNTPHLEKLTYDSGYVVNVLGGTSFADVRIPFGCTVENVQLISETNISGLSATLLDYNKANGVTLLTGKSVTANSPINFRVVADQPSGYTDNYVRIDGTKVDVNARFKVIVTIKPIQ